MQKKLLTTIVIVGVITLIGAYAYSLQSNAQNDADVFHQTSHTVNDYASTTPPLDGYVQYSNPKYHLSLYYPRNLVVSEYYAKAGQLTVTFQDPATNQGFEVFMNPYNLTTVTKQRFLLDEPSGVMNSPTAIVIDGNPATMFFGHNTLLGDTREVWFIKYDLLYEITTDKDSDAWLAQIMSTWKFVD